MENLKTYLDKLPDRWVWDPENYPVLERTDEKDRDAFRRKHVLTHMMKQIGKLAEADEKHDHMKASILDDEEGKKEIVKLLGKTMLNCLQYADIQGVTAEELDAWMMDFLSPEN